MSYYAMSQWLAAARQPPHLTAILVWEGAHDFYRDVTHHGGILSNVFTRRWYERRVVANQHGQGERGLPDCGVGGLAAGPRTLPEDQLAARRADLVTAIRDHPLDDRFHRARTAELSQITVPLLLAANWAGFGLHARGNFSGFTGAASAHKWLQVHGGRHKEWFYLPESLTLPRRFFDCFLKGAGTTGWQHRRSSCTSAVSESAFSCAPSTNGHSPAPAGPTSASTPPHTACTTNGQSHKAASPSPPSAKA